MSGLVPVARRWWWLLAVAAIVAGLTSYVVALRLERTYEAETRLLVGPINTDNDTLRAASSLAKTYAELATSRPLVEATEREVAGAAGAAALRTTVTASASDVTRLLTIRVQDEDPQRAALFANTLADELLALPRGGISRPEGQLQVVERATPPRNPIGPDPLLIVPLAAIAGLIGALGVALLVEAISGTVRNSEELAELAPVAYLGSVNGVGPTPSEPLVLQAKPASRAAAAYRLLAAKIQYAHGDLQPRSVLVAGAHSGDGAAQLAANLASALAEANAVATLVDVTGTGAVARLLNLEGEPDASVAEPVERVRCSWTRLERFRLASAPRVLVVPWVMGAPANVDEARHALDALLEDSDVVVLVAFAVDSTPSALVWARAVDAAILFVERDRTKRDAIAPAVRSLDLVGARLIGTVLAGDRV